MEAFAAILMRKTDLPDPAMMRALQEQLGLRLEARKEELDTS